ncbi:MAG: metal-dependent transcriptional regulator [Candidatus Rifleibacteriota bacterium]
MNNRLSMSLESYLETIADLQAKFGAVRTSDLAEKMGCKRSSVTNALRKLSQKGLINYQAYRPVTLTRSGQNAIKKLTMYHRTIEDFLKNLLIFSEDFASKEACKLEHNLSRETIVRLKKLMKFLRLDTTQNLDKIKKAFSIYLENDL